MTMSGTDVFLPGTADEGAYSISSTGPGDDAFHVSVCERLYYEDIDLTLGAGDDTAFLGPGEGTLTDGLLDASVEGGAGDEAMTMRWPFGEVHGGPGEDTITSHGTNGFRGGLQTFLVLRRPGSGSDPSISRVRPRGRRMWIRSGSRGWARSGGDIDG